MHSPLISIIVTVYKVEEYLDECVQSIIDQTYSNLEIILVDDGSPDRCPEMCDVWSEKDSRIKVIHKTNGGASSARNAALNVANGDFIGFVDSDDYIVENMYEVLIDALMKSTSKIASCVSVRVMPDGEICIGTGDPIEKEYNISEALEAVFLGKIGNSVWCKLFARSVWEDIRFPEGEINEEFPLIVPMLVKSNGIIHTGKTLYYYRAREGSVTSLGWNKDTHIIWKNLKIIYQQMIDHNLTGNKKAYSLFASKCAYSTALQLDKFYDKISDDAKENFRKYLRLMKQHIWCYLTHKSINIKDKILYLMVLTRTLRPIYKLLGKL